MIYIYIFSYYKVCLFYLRKNKIKKNIENYQQQFKKK